MSSDWPCAGRLAYLRPPNDSLAEPEPRHLVSDGTSIMLDAASSTLALARRLRGQLHNLAIATKSLPSIARLGSFADVDAVPVGGAAREYTPA